MKKLLSLLLCSALLISSVSVFAENDEIVDDSGITVIYSEDPILATDSAKDISTDSVSESTPAITSETVKIDVTLDGISNIQNSTAKFELYSADEKLISILEQPITADTKNFTLTFTVPRYEIGTSYKLKLSSGLKYLTYYAYHYYPNQFIDFSTYAYTDANGQIQLSEGIAVNAMPEFTKTVSVKYDGVSVDLYPGAKLIDGVTMVPARKLADYIGFDVEFNSAYNVEILSLGSSKMYFNVGTAYTTVFGTDTTAKAPTTIIDGTVYIALRTFSDAIGSTLNVTDNFTSLDINMTASQFVQNYFLNIPVNKWGIASRTNYMVWVSLSEYKVRVYQGKQYQWEQLREAPCAIGAPSTPTVTGSFEYNYTDRWNYNGYYVGPCLVFYRGYALHSVLLNYDGTEYDGRTGVQISHGCIRLKKKDIDWIYNTIPIGTRIYITQ